MASKTELLKQGVAWIEAHREELLQLYTEALRGLTVTDYYRQLPPAFLYKMVASNLDGLRSRILVGGSFDHDGVKAGLVTSIKRGISLSDLIIATETIELVFRAKAEQDLAQTQPQVYEALINRVSYIGSLMKATMAAAAIEANTDPASDKASKL